jgi:hypothetical protein
MTPLVRSQDRGAQDGGQGRHFGEYGEEGHIRINLERSFMTIWRVTTRSHRQWNGPELGNDPSTVADSGQHAGNCLLLTEMGRVRWQNLWLSLPIDIAFCTGWGAEAWASSGKGGMSA